MKLKEFIKKLNKISEKHGKELEIIMADNMPVVDPVYLGGKYSFDGNNKIVITDKLENIE